MTWFDFAGQEVFYPTHQFFLTAQCVYLLVFRLTDADCLERVQHWLRSLCFLAHRAFLFLAHSIYLDQDGDAVHA